MANNHFQNINTLLIKMRLAIVDEIINFCDVVNSSIDKKDRDLYCEFNCPYRAVCRTIGKQLEKIEIIADTLNNWEKK